MKAATRVPSGDGTGIVQNASVPVSRRLSLPSMGVTHRSARRSRSQRSWRAALWTRARLSGVHARPSSSLSPVVTVRDLTRPVGSHDVQVAVAVDEPADGVEAVEQPGEPVGGLVLELLAVASLVWHAAAERQVDPIGRPLEVVDLGLPPAHGPHLAAGGDRGDLDEGVGVVVVTCGLRRTPGTGRLATSAAADRRRRRP